MADQLAELLAATEKKGAEQQRLADAQEKHNSLAVDALENQKRQTAAIEDLIQDTKKLLDLADVVKVMDARFAIQVTLLQSLVQAIVSSGSIAKDRADQLMNEISEIAKTAASKGVQVNTGDQTNIKGNVSGDVAGEIKK